MESGGLFELLFEIGMVLIGGWIALRAVRGGATFTTDHWDNKNILDINPATGYMMLGAFDTAGNAYGEDSDDYSDDYRNYYSDDYSDD